MNYELIAALVSPQDLVKAINMFDNLNLSYKTHTFKSGLMVIQQRNLSNEEIARNICAYINMVGDGLSAYDLSVYMNTTVVLALEQALVHCLLD